MDIIGIMGYAGVGKDALASLLIEKYGYERRAFADPMRQVLYALNPIIFEGTFEQYPVRVQDLVNGNGWDFAKRRFPEIRSLLQRLGTEGGREIMGENIWVETLFKNFTGDKLVIPDVRFANELEAIHDRNGMVVRILRDGYEPVNDHTSEVVPEGADLVIVNNGTPADMLSTLEKSGFFQ